MKHLLIIFLVTALAACNETDGGSDSGSGSSPSNTSSTTSSASNESQFASQCLALIDEGQTLKAGVPVEGNHNIKITNNCNYTVKARLYSNGYVGTTVSTLLAGSSTIDDFFVTPGQPSGFACKAPLSPSVSAGGTNKKCS